MNVDIVKGDHAFSWFEQAHKQFDEGRFTTAVSADQGKAFANIQREIDVPQRPLIAAWVFKAHIMKLDGKFVVVALLDRQRAGLFVIRQGQKIDIELEVVNHIHIHANLLKKLVGRGHKLLKIPNRDHDAADCKATEEGFGTD